MAPVSTDEYCKSVLVQLRYLYYFIGISWADIGCANKWFLWILIKHFFILKIVSFDQQINLFKQFLLMWVALNGNIFRTNLSCLVCEGVFFQVQHDNSTYFSLTFIWKVSFDRKVLIFLAINWILFLDFNIKPWRHLVQVKRPNISIMRFDLNWTNWKFHFSHVKGTM